MAGSDYLCASNEVASTWADRTMGMTRMAFGPDSNVRGYFHGTSACLSALFRAGRYAEIVELLDVDTIWAYDQWAVQALAALGKKAEAIRYAEGCRSSWEDNRQIDALCEKVLLSSGLVEEAYKRYGLTANRVGTHLAWFRAVVRKYPDKTAAQVIADLVAITPVRRENGSRRQRMPGSTKRPRSLPGPHRATRAR